MLSPRIRNWYLPRFQKSILGELVVSREYEEMKVEHLRAVGRAVREVTRPTAKEAPAV